MTFWKMKQGFVYILANERLVLYVGVTNNLIRRVYEHKNNFDVKSFTAKYAIHKLVYYEILPNMELAIIREKQIKDMNRGGKLKLIYSKNSNFEDLYDTII